MTMICTIDLQHLSFWSRGVTKMASSLFKRLFYYLSHRSVYPLYLNQKGGRMTNIEND